VLATGTRSSRSAKLAVRELFPSLSSRATPRRWSIKTMPDVRSWLRASRQANPDVFRSVNVAIDVLAETGPALGRPTVDTLQGDSSRRRRLRNLAGRGAEAEGGFVSEFEDWDDLRAELHEGDDEALPAKRDAGATDPVAAVWVCWATDEPARDRRETPVV
jgi:hypothetical protein